MLSERQLIGAYRDYRRRLATDRSWWKDLVDFGKHDLPQRTTSSPEGFMFGMLARDCVRELINVLNRWRHDIAGLSTWATILDRYDDQERFNLLWEFVEPIAESTLGRPYAIRSRITYVACRLLDLALPDQGRPSLDERKVDFQVLVKLGEDRPSCLALRDALGEMNGAAFRTATADFRHRSQHRVPPGIEQGVVSIVTRSVDQFSNPTLGFGVTEPLRIRDLIPALLREHAAAVRGFERLWELVQELNGELLTRERNESSEG